MVAAAASAATASDTNASMDDARTIQSMPMGMSNILRRKRPLLWKFASNKELISNGLKTEEETRTTRHDVGESSSSTQLPPLPPPSSASHKSSSSKTNSRGPMTPTSNAAAREEKRNTTTVDKEHHHNKTSKFRRRPLELHQKELVRTKSQDQEDNEEVTTTASSSINRQMRHPTASATATTTATQQQQPQQLPQKPSNVNRRIHDYNRRLGNDSVMTMEHAKKLVRDAATSTKSTSTRTTTEAVAKSQQQQPIASATSAFTTLKASPPPPPPPHPPKRPTVGTTKIKMGRARTTKRRLSRRQKMQSLRNGNLKTNPLQVISEVTEEFSDTNDDDDDDDEVDDDQELPFDEEYTNLHNKTNSSPKANVHNGTSQVVEIQEEKKMDDQYYATNYSPSSNHHHHHQQQQQQQLNPDRHHQQQYTGSSSGSSSRSISNIGPKKNKHVTFNQKISTSSHDTVQTAIGRSKIVIATKNINKNYSSSPTNSNNHNTSINKTKNIVPVSILRKTHDPSHEGHSSHARNLEHNQQKMLQQQHHYNLRQQSRQQQQQQYPLQQQRQPNPHSDDMSKSLLQKWPNFTSYSPTLPNDDGNKGNCNNTMVKNDSSNVHDSVITNLSNIVGSNTTEKASSLTPLEHQRKMANRILDKVQVHHHQAYNQRPAEAGGHHDSYVGTRNRQNHASPQDRPKTGNTVVVASSSPTSVMHSSNDPKTSQLIQKMSRREYYNTSPRRNLQSSFASATNHYHPQDNRNSYNNSSKNHNANIPRRLV